MRRRRIVHRIEQDVHTGWRRLYARYQRAGAARKDKNFTNRRERREGKDECLKDGPICCGHNDPLCTMYGCTDDPRWKGDRR